MNLLINSHQYPFIIVDKLDLCDTCNHAKQKKLPFSLSTTATTATTAIFGIIHFDIWVLVPLLLYARF